MCYLPAARACSCPRSSSGLVSVCSGRARASRVPGLPAAPARPRDAFGCLRLALSDAARAAPFLGPRAPRFPQTVRRRADRSGKVAERFQDSERGRALSFPAPTRLPRVFLRSPTIRTGARDVLNTALLERVTAFTVWVPMLHPRTKGPLTSTFHGRLRATSQTVPVSCLLGMQPLENQSTEPRRRNAVRRRQVRCRRRSRRATGPCPL